MSRLTFKDKRTKVGIRLPSYCNKYQEQVFSKLGQLENLEEELGIDLITLFKALREGIYIESMWDNHEIIKEVNVELEYTSGEYKICPDMQIKRNIKNYGKTWALTREELEHNDK